MQHLNDVVSTSNCDTTDFLTIHVNGMNLRVHNLRTAICTWNLLESVLRLKTAVFVSGLGQVVQWEIKPYFIMGRGSNN